MSDLMTPREFAELAGMRLDLLYTLWAQGRGPERTRRGKHVYIARDEATRWMQAQKRLLEEAS